jgi:hypothetical protein
MKRPKTRTLVLRSRDYGTMLNRVVSLIDEARRASARSVNAIMTGTYWLIGRHIIEFEQRGKFWAAYGEELIKQLADDLLSATDAGFPSVTFRKCDSFTWVGQFCRHRLQNLQLAAARLFPQQKRRHCLQN